MKWRKLGLVWRPDGSRPWARSHAMLPTPLRLNEHVIRVFVACLDAQGRGLPGYVDVAADDPTHVVGASTEPLLDLGVRGAFDDNGVAPLCALRLTQQRVLLYYAGFELCANVRYRIFTGLARSEDGGATFQRVSRAAVLDRSHDELYFRCGTFVMVDGSTYRMWYVAGSAWTDVAGKEVPVYTLRYQESHDGLNWQRAGTPVLDLEHADEHGFGRPWVVKDAARGYRMFYSVRSRARGAYRLGYAESPDGLHWTRRDDDVGLEESPQPFETHGSMYLATIDVGVRTYAFYNGNDFGRDGFAAAELVK